MNRYDDRARLVFHFAREEGSKLGHAMIGPEHLLLGLMREGGTASRVLSELGGTLEGFRRQVEDTVGRGDGLPLAGSVVCSLFSSGGFTIHHPHDSTDARR